MAQRLPLRRAGTATALGVVGLVLLAGCSHHKPADKAAGEAPAPATATGDSGGFMTGSIGGNDPNAGKFINPNAPPPAPMEDGAKPKFAKPKPSKKPAPALASVPDKAPTPPSSRQDRDKAVEGLVADREHARHADLTYRTVPVAVRPLSEAAAAPETEPAAPPVPQSAEVGAVTRLGNQPAPGKGGKGAKPTPTIPAAEGDTPDQKAALAAAAQVAATATPPAPPAELAPGPRLSAVPAARNDGFRPLATYDATTSLSNEVASIDFSGTGTSISATGRRALSDAAKLGERSKGAFRVIARTAEPSNLVQDRATAVARELQRLGVTPDRIFVGTDAGQDGRVDVILDQ